MILPICTSCSIQMHCVKNDYVVRQTFVNGTGIYYYGDRYECQQCNLSIVTGFGKRRYFETSDLVAGQKHNVTSLQAYPQEVSATNQD